MALNYQKTNWVNNETKLNADNMNKIEDGIKNASDEVSVLKSDITDIKSGTIQQTPLFANSTDECTDTTKLYVLPDGYIYMRIGRLKITTC